MKNRIINWYYARRFVVSTSIVVMLFIFGLSSLILVSGQQLPSGDTHVVSLYVDGKEYDIPTRAKTVGELLAKAEIDLGEHDIVEPSNDQQITVDGFRVRVSRARAYIVRDGNKELAALSAHTSARLIAEAAGLNLKPADAVDFAPLDTISVTEIGRVVEVVRSKQIIVSLYGVPQEVHTNSATVQDLLTELGVDPPEGDVVTPNLTNSIIEGMTVYINRNGIQVVSEELAIDPPVEYVQDNDLTLGSTAVRDPGKPGKRVVTYEILMQNGQEVGRTEISSVIIEQPITKIVARGRAAGQIGAEKEQLMAAAGILPEEYAAADYIISRESGWCATKWQGQWGICPPFYEEKYPGAESVKTLGYGLCQSTPAIKMATAGEDWRTNPVTQLVWCTSYARGRYGDWNKAYDFWIEKHWW